MRICTTPDTMGKRHDHPFFAVGKKTREEGEKGLRHACSGSKRWPPSPKATGTQLFGRARVSFFPFFFLFVSLFSGWRESYDVSNWWAKFLRPRISKWTDSIVGAGGATRRVSKGGPGIRWNYKWRKSRAGTLWSRLLQTRSLNFPFSVFFLSSLHAMGAWPPLLPIVGRCWLTTLENLKQKPLFLHASHDFKYQYLLEPPGQLVKHTSLTSLAIT